MKTIRRVVVRDDGIGIDVADADAALAEALVDVTVD